MDRARGHLPGEVQTTSSLARLKILTLGDQQVGKSCLIKRYCEGKFIAEYIPTIGIDYGVKTVSIPNLQNPQITTEGPSHYYETRAEFYKDSHGVLLMFSISNRESFTNLKHWVEEFKTLSGDQDKCVVYVVGTKSDDSRQVTFEEARQFSQKLGHKYYETSSAVGSGVKECLEGLFKDVLMVFGDAE